MDLSEAKARHGMRFVLKGNLDAVREILRADAETLERAVMEQLRIGMHGSGYILTSACAVSPRVSPVRLQRMVELAERFGHYG